MKMCTKCNEEKPIEDFYRRKDTLDGHRTNCKICQIAASKKWSLENPEQNAATYKKWCLEHPEKIAASNKKWQQANPDKRKAYSVKYKARNPLKINATYTLNNAIQSGKLIKPTKCETCDAEVRIHAHHCDYNKPLEVMWLCQSCHINWHQIHGTDLNNETNINITI